MTLDARFEKAFLCLLEDWRRSSFISIGRLENNEWESIDGPVPDQPEVATIVLALSLFRATKDGGMLYANNSGALVRGTGRSRGVVIAAIFVFVGLQQGGPS